MDPGMIDDVRAGMAAAGVDALVLRPSPDFRYLGGRGAGYLVLTLEGPPRTARGPAEAASLVPVSARRVAVDPETRARELLIMGLDAELMLASVVLGPLRLTKRPAEVAALRRAASAADSVLLAARDLTWFGATERGMGYRLRAMLAEAGCDEALSVVVAAGEHTADPAHTPCDRVINPGDAVAVSVCGRWDGYCAEVARVFAVAEPPEDFEAMYSVVLAAQQAASGVVRAGVPASEPARLAREVIDGSGYGHYMSERQGRGIGLSDHEGPSLDSGELLAPGMTVCLETAIHLPDLFGARVADVVLCGPEGPERLSSGPQALHIADH
ncbi:Xaa-Pro peptidase family protein [Planotetraspora phitsanulokensis]|uniref:Aminopeptidase n=2 Tax=Planotetraspora phitsanulokensis TaxID=575192 RepID=A0A8J3U287_9ACTN|nr:aminopeptidase [Planotetraspora phitsanulokensis]